MKQRQEVGRVAFRVAFRVEGENWCAYYATMDTMEGAIFLGSIRMGAVRNNPERKEAFMALMRGIIDEFFEENFGENPDWNAPEPGPEHERSGRA